MNVLVWFNRDLRAADHPALARAAGEGAVLPVFVADPQIWQQPDRSGRQWDFVAESLTDLRYDLAALGAPLVVRVGPAAEALAGLCRRHRIGRILSHASAGGDPRLVNWARGAGIDWTEVSSSAPCPQVEGLSPVPGVEPGVIPSARALRLVGDRCAHRQPGGRAAGLQVLESFLSVRGEGYRASAGDPAKAERSSSRLSPYLAQGCLSLREVDQAAAARMAERPGGHWPASLSAFRGRLARRGAIPAQTCPGAGSETAVLAAWAGGATGLPQVDATMRYLGATGWLNDRSRSMVLSVALHHLGLDLQAAGAALARLCTDFDPALHWPAVQAVAAGPSCNPLRPGRRAGSGVAFTRRWVPELADVPEDFLLEPWNWSGARRVLGRRYPEPVSALTAQLRLDLGH